ncbi:MAG TPA: LysM peptidoglycan-binding domain-containing protein [Acidimicrobiia bacterium]|nr:LysM peptidoglycan-binding domain-containing protein [Acidimicrobiia bacterium]
MPGERKTAIAIGVLVAVLVGAVFELTRLGASDAGRPTRAGAASEVTTTAPPRAPTSTTRPPVGYQVQPGDTLTSIARRFGLSTAAIAAANQLTDPNSLTVGQTVLIPPVPPVQLVLAPADATDGQSVDLQLTGAKPSEMVTFRVDSPNGTFTGPPHTASTDGKVTATYTVDVGDPPGTYTVIADGSQGTTARADLRVSTGNS